MNLPAFIVVVPFGIILIIMDQMQCIYSKQATTIDIEEGPTEAIIIGYIQVTTTTKTKTKSSNIDSIVIMIIQ